MKDCLIINTTQIDLMKHCLGFDNDKVTGTKHRKYEAYRNYFTSSGDHSDWDDLVKQGLATKRDFPHGVGDIPQVYFVSDDGKEFLGKIIGVEISETD